MAEFHTVTSFIKQYDSGNDGLTYEFETVTPYPHTAKVMVPRMRNQSVDDMFTEARHIDDFVTMRIVVIGNDIYTLPGWVMAPDDPNAEMTFPDDAELLSEVGHAIGD